MVDLNGAAAAALIGPGVQTELLSAFDSSDGEFDRTVSNGTVTYTYTPSNAPVPEPSTWAMMLVGFAGLGYAAVRRKTALGRGLRVSGRPSGRSSRKALTRARRTVLSADVGKTGA